MVDRQWLAGSSEIEEPLGVAALAGELIEVLREFGGLLVALADVLDDPIGPDLHGFAVAGVDPLGEVAVVRRLAIVVRDEPCSDSMSGNRYAQTVTVELDGEPLSPGCGAPR